MWKVTLTMAIVALVVVLIIRYAIRERTAEARGTQGSVAAASEAFV